MNGKNGNEEKALVLPGELGREAEYLQEIMRGIEDQAIREKCVMLVSCMVDDVQRVARNMELATRAAIEQRNEALREVERVREVAEFGEAVRRLDLSNPEVRKFLIRMKKELAAGARR